MAVRFLRFGYRSSYTDGSAWASQFRSDWETTRPCPRCGSTRQRPTGPATCIIEAGLRWTDAIGTSGGSPPFIVSKRVVEGLQAIGAQGYMSYPVAIERISAPALSARGAPKYYYIAPVSSVEVDLPASGSPPGARCPRCLAAQVDPPPREQRWVPKTETWDGADIFGLGWFPFGYFCTERVMQLARDGTWTNFRFDPIDILERHIPRWSGIDYLGRQWPPEWYPDSPSRGKSFGEWVALTRLSGDAAVPYAIELHELESASHVTPELIEEVSEMYARSAAEALLDYPEEAQGAMVIQLREGAPLERRNAAYVLSRLRQEHRIPLPDDVRELIRQNTPDFVESLIE
jgi:hypothetical protein